MGDLEKRILRTETGTCWSEDPATRAAHVVTNIEVEITGDSNEYKVYSLNTVIDEERNMSLVNFGDVLHSHQAAVDYVRQYCEVPIPRRYHTVVTSGAGYPLDKTYYQTIKGMVGALDILAPGGNLIIASECSEGMGSSEFVTAQQRLVQSGPDAFLAEILAKSHADIDEWQTQKQLEPMSVGNVYLFSDKLLPSHHRSTGVEVVSSIDDAIRQSLTRHSDKSVAVIPEGPYVVPFYRTGDVG